MLLITLKRKILLQTFLKTAFYGLDTEPEHTRTGTLTCLKSETEP